MITLPDFLGHIGYISITAGMILLARKNIWGWLLRAMGEALWISIGVMLDLSSVYIWGFVFLGIEAYGFYTWREMKKQEAT